MSRKPTDFTKDIRTLLEQHQGELTHGQIRPLLEELGWEVAKKPKPASDLWKQVMEYSFEGKFPTQEEFNDVLDDLRFSDKDLRSVKREYRIRVEFNTERNHFDVTKYNWSSNPSNAEVQRKSNFKKIRRAIANNNKKLEKLRERMATIQSKIDQFESQNQNLQSQLDSASEAA